MQAEGTTSQPAKCASRPLIWAPVSVLDPQRVLLPAPAVTVVPTATAVHYVVVAMIAFVRHFLRPPFFRIEQKFVSS